jgi:hypothetical protein
MLMLMGSGSVLLLKRELDLIIKEKVETWLEWHANITDGIST